MFQIVLAIHLVLCVFLVSVVLLQQGKGAEAGVTFTGGSNTIFGVSGAGNVLTKATTGAAVLFMLTSLLLVKYYPVGGVSTGGSISDPLKGSVMERVAPAVEKGTEAGTESVTVPQDNKGENGAALPAEAGNAAATASNKVETKPEEAKSADKSGAVEKSADATPKEAAPK